VNTLAKNLDKDKIFLEAPVSDIYYSEEEEGKVTVILTSGREFIADRVIVTVPLGVL